MSGIEPPGGPVERIELAPGYSIARIVNGAWQLSAGHRRGAADRDAAIEGLLRRAEAGLTTFDCADIYTGVEALLGDVLRAWRRRGGDAAPAELEIHTKLVPDLADLRHLAPARRRAQRRAFAPAPRRRAARPGPAPLVGLRRPGLRRGRRLARTTCAARARSATSG